MEYRDSKFYVSLDGKLTQEDAAQILKDLAENNDGFYDRVQENAREAFLSRGVEISEELARIDVRLPSREALQRVVGPIYDAAPVEIAFDPFGPWVPGERPFIVLLLLVAAASV
jgi:hypothetical protein